MGLIKYFKELFLEYAELTFGFVGRVFLSSMAVWAILVMRQHGTPAEVLFAALLGWFWFIWHKWE